MKTRRHDKILDLIHEHDIDTQDELLRLLREGGFDVTQATVSRDIKELRLIKTLSSDGNYKYATGKDASKDISSKFFSLFADSAVSVDRGGNIVSIKCLTGMAQAVCAAMDSIHWDGVVGTLAGDDTIFVLCRDENYAMQHLTDLKKLIVNK